MNRDVISYLACPNCNSNRLTLEEYSLLNGEVQEGRIICLLCNTWYRIENSVIDLLPLNLRRNDFYNKFAIKHKLALSNSKYKICLKDKELRHKIGQINFFKEDVDNYENKVVNSTFYKALDKITYLDFIKRNSRNGQKALDLGCGTGKQCIPLAQHGVKTIGVDISEEMVVLAKKKIDALGLGPYIDLVVGDAEIPPVADNCFDFCICYGTLHHFHNPQDVIFNASRKLVKNGLFYSLDPHKSPVRFIFDLLMRIHKLYDERASDSNQLLSEDQLKQWHYNADMKAVIRLSTYLLPHLCYRLSTKTNIRFLKMSDLIFNKIFFLRKFAGIVISEAIKR